MDKIEIEKHTLNDPNQKMPTKTLMQIEDESKQNENNINFKMWSEAIATITFVKSTGTIMYPSCTKCPKKAQQVSDT